MVIEKRQRTLPVRIACAALRRSPPKSGPAVGQSDRVSAPNSSSGETLPPRGFGTALLLSPALQPLYRRTRHGLQTFSRLAPLMHRLQQLRLRVPADHQNILSLPPAPAPENHARTIRQSIFSGIRRFQESGGNRFSIWLVQPVIHWLLGPHSQPKCNIPGAVENLQHVIAQPGVSECPTDPTVTVTCKNAAAPCGGRPERSIFARRRRHFPGRVFKSRQLQVCLSEMTGKRKGAEPRGAGPGAAVRVPNNTEPALDKQRSVMLCRRQHWLVQPYRPEPACPVIHWLLGPHS